MTWLLSDHSFSCRRPIQGSSNRQEELSPNVSQKVNRERSLEPGWSSLLPLEAPRQPFLHRCCRSLLPQNSANSSRFFGKLPDFCNKNPGFHLGFVAKLGFPREWLTIFATKHRFCHDLRQNCCKKNLPGLHPCSSTPGRLNCQRAVARPLTRSAHRRSNQQTASSTIIDDLSRVL